MTAQADVYFDRLSNAIELLQSTALIGAERLEFTPPVRIHHHASQLPIYAIDEGGIAVIRVLHASMDVDFQLEE